MGSITFVAEPDASRFNCIAAFVSSARKIVAWALFPSAETPRLIEGMRCAVIVPVAETSGLAFSVIAAMKIFILIKQSSGLHSRKE